MARTRTTRSDSLRRTGKKKTTGTKRSNTRSTNDDWVRKVRAHRRRQASVAAILDQTLGELGKCNPDLWDRRAYLMLVGLVYERLATCEEELSTDELVSLAKVLAENRRAEVRFRNHQGEKPIDESRLNRKGELPENFAGVVRQVYGTNFQSPNRKDREKCMSE